jgi:hypothetical protein
MDNFYGQVYQRKEVPKAQVVETEVAEAKIG